MSTEKEKVEQIIKDIDAKESIFHMWKGTIERTPDYFRTKPDLISNGVPKHLWEKLSEVCPPVKEALEAVEVEEEVGKLIDSFTDKIHLAEQIIEAVPLYYDNSTLWWKWSSGFCKWEIVDEVDLMNLVTNASPANTILSKERGEIIQALKQVSRMKAPKDAPKSWLQFEKEIVNLDTGDKFPATAEYFLTNPLPYGLSGKDETPTIDRIFEEWVGKDEVLKLKQIIAYCMIRDYPLSRIFCFIGAGMNGKSKYLDLLRKFIGDKNVCSTELDVLLNSRFEVTRLHKKLVCQMGETNFNEMSKTSMLKKLTGGDLIGMEYKNKNHFDEVNYAKILIATNNLPATTDKTVGFYRRWLIVDFPNEFTEAKDILSEIPEKEYNNLSTQLVTILMDLLSSREFSNEGSIDDRMKRYEAKSNFLEEFIMTFTTGDVNGYITKADFFRRFRDWCKENRHREMSEASLGKAMKTRGIETARRNFEWFNDGKGGQARVFLEIKWKE